MKYEGLSNKEVIESRKKYGSNAIGYIKENSFVSLLLESFADPIIRILLIALGIKVVFLFKDFDFFETIGIVIAIFIASFISTMSEYGSEKAFNRLQEEASMIKCRVKRNNEIVEIVIDDIVKNDIVMLTSGDKVPADGKIIKGNLKVDLSMLNGETKEELVNEMNSSLFRGSVIYDGNAVMLVEATGENTMYGKIAKELQEMKPESPLKIRLRGLAKVVSKIGYFGALLVSLSYLFSVIVINNNYEFPRIIETITNLPVLFGHILYALTLSVTVIVVAVPEGLPMMINLVLSSNMKKMLKEKVLVRRLVGIETAGSINVLLSDKTGTITKGKFETVGFYCGNLKKFNNINELNTAIKYKKIVVESIGNNVESYYDKSGKIIGGNITDRAVLDFIKQEKFEKKDIINQISFNSNNKYALCETKDRTYIKGAPERILPYINSFYDLNGKEQLFHNREKLKNIIDNYTEKGMRVLLLANNDRVNNLKYFNNLILVGIILIKDEIRDEAKEGLNLVRNAGIHTIMITGDSKKTAIQIGKEIGLINNSNDIIYSSDDLKNMSDEEIKNIFSNIKIVARALPQDKSRLVKIAQELNLVVGMTGDGVNDAPALKKADVGFAMGSGTEVSKEASDIVILNNNFLSIAKAILFGRTIFKNIRKFIVFQLTVNMCAVMMSIVGPFLGIGTPITIIQMLWINMIMDTLAGLAFSYEPPLLEYMNEKPKNKKEPIINKYMYGQILFTGLYTAMICVLFLKLPMFRIIIRPSVNYQYLLTAYFSLFVFLSIFNAFNARTERINVFANILKNKVFLGIIIFISVIQFLLIYFGGNLFRTYGLNIKEIILVLLISLSVIPIDWIRKIFVKKCFNNKL